MLASGNSHHLLETTTMPLPNPSLFVGLWGARTTTVVLEWPCKARIANTQELHKNNSHVVLAIYHETKPFEPRELAARLQTILRRTRTPAEAGTRLHFDGLSIDLERRSVARQGSELNLTGTEFELLVMLASEPQKVFSRDEILNQLRGHEAELYTRAVDILVSRLRKKLEPLDCIKTLRNAGYAFAGARH